jgi:hypothetical protein
MLDFRAVRWDNAVMDPGEIRVTRRSDRYPGPFGTPQAAEAVRAYAPSARIVASQIVG